MMSTEKQTAILVCVLTLIGLGAVLYKVESLGFSLLPDDRHKTWNIEAKIDFEAAGEETTIVLNAPDKNPAIKISYFSQVSDGYEFKTISNNGVEFLQWQSPKAEGHQTLYFRAQVWFADEPEISAQIDSPDKPTWSEANIAIAQNILKKIDDKLPLENRVLLILDTINDITNKDINVLLAGSRKRSDKIELAIKLLAWQGIHARSSKGMKLVDKARQTPALFFIEVHDGSHWQIFDPLALKQLSWNKVIILQRNDEPLLDIYGGSDSTIKFSAIKTTEKTSRTAISTALANDNQLVDFSIYSLPIAQQSAFKTLLLIPLGALVVVILRNIIGIRTSGTFMPILLAMVFIQTSLATGVALFILIVGMGLIMRSWLSRLNLLLVPRIASVLVFVIIIYAGIGIISHKYNIQQGMSVTFFPMIILSWTVERMCILWEEEGLKEVLIQSGGSLITASLAYLIMSNEFIADLIFIFPELLLVILAIIISIGSYSGYRLSDLYRFAPMKNYQD